MSLSLIQSFGRNVTVSSAVAAGAYVDGIWQEPMREDLVIVASVQNLSAKEMLLLSEGDRQKEWKKLYSLYNFKVQKDGDLTPSDYINIDGKDFMVIKSANYVDHNAMNITYYRADVCSVTPKNQA